MLDEAEIEQTNVQLYAVFRNGRRVSSSEYQTEREANHEKAYWEGIIRNYPDGSKIAIRPVRRTKNTA